ncbi:hypothetical protein BUALT_Bualt02G0217800 [Buddleja alternifolia]|uniref:FLZ-type domain-containing protein n=1 Tax=Buddleja alternifolia TaxID=168488 RepID=A0AAV6YAY9_9LAMI|nr:hypothetical protein BUALT_Bualt02G0217800 [Buddleja alternifolia]
MLRNRSRAVTSKQASLMADHNNTSMLSSPTTTTPISSFLGSPRFFNGFLTKNISDSENNTLTMSPTSILDTKNSSTFVNPFGFDRNLPKSPENNNKKSEPGAIGLAMIDSIIEEKNDVNFSNKPINRMALLGSKLKVQIPVINNPSLSPVESPKSPADFGIKTRNSQFSSPFPSTPSKDFTRQLSLKEMELSEDYTCVITHGPNPKTTHIFDDCIVESCSVDGDHDHDDDDESNIFSHHKKMESGFEIETSESAHFMSFCHTCKDILGQDKDIYIYRILTDSI